MQRPPKLTDAQKKRVTSLEKGLRKAVQRGDSSSAKIIVADIQGLLRHTGHETRLMQSKNWLFEAAMEAGELTLAISGLAGVRARVSPKTRVFLEATALLAICHLRKNEIAVAEPLMKHVLQNCDVITSEKRRRLFRLRMVRRFEEEALLAALAGSGTSCEKWDIESVQADAGELLQKQTEDQILDQIGSAVSPEVIAILLQVDQFARKQLPAADVVLLPPVRTISEKMSLGRTVLNSTRRVVWRSICDPESEIYKVWCTNGLMGLLDKSLSQRLSSQHSPVCA